MGKKNKRLQKGFTLIELIIVIAILGVLALLIVPNVKGRVDAARKSVDDANAKAIENAINQYIAESGDETCSALAPLTDVAGVVTQLKEQIEYPDGSNKKYGPYLSSSATYTPQQQGKVFKITITSGGAKVDVVDADASDQTTGSSNSQ